MVIDRGAFLAGRHLECSRIAAVKEAWVRPSQGDPGDGRAGHPRRGARASMLAMAAGADFIKTSTGKVQPAATLPVGLVMLEAIRDFERLTGVAVGMKPAGGIRVSKDAIKWLVMVHETLGSAWLTPDRFRIGASSLLNDVLMPPLARHRPLPVPRLLHRGLTCPVLASPNAVIPPGDAKTGLDWEYEASPQTAEMVVARPIWVVHRRAVRRAGVGVVVPDGQPRHEDELAEVAEAG